MEIRFVSCRGEGGVYLPTFPTIFPQFVDYSTGIHPPLKYHYMYFMSKWVLEMVWGTRGHDDSFRSRPPKASAHTTPPEVRLKSKEWPPIENQKHNDCLTVLVILTLERDALALVTSSKLSLFLCNAQLRLRLCTASFAETSSKGNEVRWIIDSGCSG